MPASASFLNRGEGGASACAVSFHSALGEMQQKSLRCRHPTLSAVLPNYDHLPEQVIVGNVAAPTFRPTSGIAALPFLKRVAAGGFLYPVSSEALGCSVMAPFPRPFQSIHISVTG